MILLFFLSFLLFHPWKQWCCALHKIQFTTLERLSLEFSLHLFHIEYRYHRRCRWINFHFASFHFNSVLCLSSPVSRPLSSQVLLPFILLEMVRQKYAVTIEMLCIMEHKWKVWVCVPLAARVSCLNKCNRFFILRQFPVAAADAIILMMACHLCIYCEYVLHLPKINGKIIHVRRALFPWRPFRTGKMRFMERNSSVVSTMEIDCVRRHQTNHKLYSLLLNVLKEQHHYMLWANLQSMLLKFPSAIEELIKVSRFRLCIHYDAHP